MLNEQERRRPNFQGGYPIELYDGQLWSFIPPRINRRPRGDRRGAKAFADIGNPEFEEAFREYMKAAAEQVISDEDFFDLAIELPTLNLQTNYDLTRDEVGEILRLSWVKEEDPKAFEIREAVMSVCLGRGPKVKSDGSSSSTSESEPSDPLTENFS